MAATDNSKTLQDLSQGDLYSKDMAFNAVVQGKRLRHSFIKNLVSQLRDKKVNDTDILDILLMMDKGVESGDLSEEDLFSL